MDKNLDGTRELFIARVRDLLADQGGEDHQVAEVQAFADAYFANAQTSFLQKNTPETLLEIVDAHWRQLKQSIRTGAGVETSVLVADSLSADSASESERPVTFIQTTMPDLPFLVDSLRIVVRRFSEVIAVVHHPVIYLRPSDSGRYDVSISPQSKNDPAATAAADSIAVSLVHVECDPLADAETREQLAAEIRAVLNDLQAVVADWRAMQEQLRSTTAELKNVASNSALSASIRNEASEASEFLAWLDQGHFTYLGCGETNLQERAEGAEFQFDEASALGLLRNNLSNDAAAFRTPPAEVNRYVSSARILVITKDLRRSYIHHHERMDTVAVKRFNEAGEIVGTIRFIGLFSDQAFQAPPKSIPLLRQKMTQAIAMANLRPGSHRAKAFVSILENLPRDELFQSSEAELKSVAEALSEIPDIVEPELFLRNDRYARFVTAMVWLPKDRYSAAICDAMGQLLCKALSASSFSFQVEFLRGAQARIYFLLETPSDTAGEQPQFSADAVDELERQLGEILKGWSEQLRDALVAEHGSQGGSALWSQYAKHFPAEYQAVTPSKEAAEDVFCIDQLRQEAATIPRLLLPSAGEPRIRLKLFSRGAPEPLSQVLPTLENFGFLVRQQTPYELSSSQPGIDLISLQEFSVSLVSAPDEPIGDDIVTEFEQAWAACQLGKIENDRLNSLILTAGLSARNVALLRCLSRYLLQIGLPYSREFVESVICESADLSELLVQLFEARFRPENSPAELSKQKNLSDEMVAALEQVQSLDKDRIFRNLLSIVQAAIRTNYYQLDAQSEPKAWISLKLKSEDLEELPEPRPLYETFVCSPDVEGVHLRGGKVARGGLRWSDRREDFRTEVLGLVKAQMVKNAVIVPLGAKGGFVVKRDVPASDRQQQGLDCYKTFIRGLLDISDNQVDSAIVAPERTLRYDDDDPYLVVAADKGTATFSDVANSISAEYDFWLGDAFASGGSAGYDHKKMGITAKGAWVCVQRHFAEMGVDCQSEDFTAVGIGDMAGDVFGNGMLLSTHTRLVAAFNHQHIFFDPAPDIASSFSERQRLFNMGRSSWSDYDQNLISAGGGIWLRSAKSIPLSEQMQEMLQVSAERLTPNELIRAILKAPVDLLWNGGIGTYVKAESESALDVGDRANDALRIDATELRCKIVGEGGNLGLTQLARIEFALHGGRVNSDFIDNSGGVNSSDREVNLKIPLNKLVQAGTIELEARNALLERMTEEVSAAVLGDSDQQAQALSIMQYQSSGRLDEARNLLALLERDSGQYRGLDRALEFLPSDEEIDERRRAGRGFTRPELAVVQAYAKMGLYQALLESSVPDDSFFDVDLIADFPAEIRNDYRDVFLEHPLRRELVSTHLVNNLVHRMGAAYAHRSAEEDGVDLARVVRCFELARRVYSADGLWQQVEQLPASLLWSVRAELLVRVSRLMKFATQWFITHEGGHEPLDDVAARYQTGVAEFKKNVREWLLDDYLESWQRTRDRHHKAGVEREKSGELAAMKFMGAALDVADISLLTGEPIALVGDTHLRVGVAFSIPWLVAATVNMKVDGRWPALARATLRDEAYRIHRELTLRILSAPGDDAITRLEVWLNRNRRAQKFARRRISELAAIEAQDFATLTVAMRELRSLL